MHDEYFMHAALSIVNVTGAGRWLLFSFLIPPGALLSYADSTAFHWGVLVAASWYLTSILTLQGHNLHLLTGVLIHRGVSGA